MSVDSGPVQCSVSYQWRFEVSLGLVGVATVDGRVLAVPDAPVQPQSPEWARALPLPAMGYPCVSRAGDSQGGFEHQMVPVARIESVVLRDGRELWASGSFADDLMGRHYAGALALDAVALAVNVDRCEPEQVGETLVFTGWRLAGAVFVHESPWEQGAQTHPRVWRQQVTGP